MPGERIANLINAAQAQIDNVQYLDAAVPLLSRRLLYGDPSLEDEIAGYGYLRSLTINPDKTIRKTAARALEQRWVKVGFYKLDVPDRRYSSGLTEDDRPFFDISESYRFASGVEDDAKIAILELARRREPMTPRQFKDAMAPLIGIRKDSLSLVDELKRLHVLTDELQYVPVAESIRARVRMTEAAYGVLAPHLPVLEAISYPNLIISEEDKRLAIAVGTQVDRILAKSVAFWTDGNIQGLTMPKEPSFGGGYIHLLDSDLNEQKRSSQGQSDIISFVTEQGLYKLTYENDPLFLHYHRNKQSVEVKMYQLRDGQDQLFLDLWGQQVLGRNILGTLGVYRDSGDTNYVEASGVFTTVLPEGLHNANTVDISAEKMGISLDIPGRGRNINFDVYYQKFQAEPPTSTIRFGLGKPYVTNEPIRITVPAKHPEITKVIELDKDEELTEVRHPKGKYTVAYEKVEGGIKITFTGKNWENTVIVPAQINPFNVVRSIGQQLEKITQRVSDEKEAIQQQVANVTHMGLIEHFFFNNFGMLPTKPRYLSYFFEEELYKRLVDVEKGLTALDADAQYCAKYYMRALGRIQNTLPGKTKTSTQMDEEAKDIKQEFKRVIEKHGINIPKEFLVLLEEVFIPEE